MVGVGGRCRRTFIAIAETHDKKGWWHSRWDPRVINVHAHSDRV